MTNKEKIWGTVFLSVSTTWVTIWLFVLVIKYCIPLLLDVLGENTK